MLNGIPALIFCVKSITYDKRWKILHTKDKIIRAAASVIYLLQEKSVLKHSALFIKTIFRNDRQIENVQIQIAVKFSKSEIRIGKHCSKNEILNREEKAE